MQNKASLTPFSPVMCHGLLGRGYKLLSSELVSRQISWLVGNQSLWILIAAPAEVITSNINNAAHLPVQFSVMLKVRLTPQSSWGILFCLCFPYLFPFTSLNIFIKHWFNWNVNLSVPLFLCLLIQVINKSLLVSVKLSLQFCVHGSRGWSLLADLLSVESSRHISHQLFVPVFKFICISREGQKHLGAKCSSNHGIV